MFPNDGLHPTYVRRICRKGADMEEELVKGNSMPLGNLNSICIGKTHLKEQQIAFRNKFNSQKNINCPS
jgi:hypothetical protein